MLFLWLKNLISVTRFIFVLYTTLFLLLAGCSFSNSKENKILFCTPELTPESKNQLTEQEVLDTEPTYRITEETIQQAIKNIGDVNFYLPLGARIILVQSGKQVPDTAMQEAMLKYYQVSVYSGLPPNKTRLKSARKNDIDNNDDLGEDLPPPSYMKNLRLIAAKAKQDKIVVYWSNLELGTLSKDNKTIIWRSYPGGEIASTTKYLRYLVRFALVDVKTGTWIMYAPTNQQNEFIKYSFNSIENDITQVSQVKNDTYRFAAQNLFEHFEGFNLKN